jgi:SAM-dependent methyltransferase
MQSAARALTSAPPIPADRDLAGRHPTGNRYNWLAKRLIGNAIALAAGRYAQGRLIDIGCGEKPYRDVFAPYVSEHIGVDHPDSPHALTFVDVLATADTIPVESSTFDTAVMSELLEHLEEPRAALLEAGRLLKPGGHLIITTPFIWVLHEEPRDFFRYSPHGLRWLLESAGLEVVEITPIGGQWTTLALLGSYALSRMPSRLWWVTSRMASTLLHVGWRLERRHFQPWMSWDHLAVARKPV